MQNNPIMRCSIEQVSALDIGSIRQHDLTASSRQRRASKLRSLTALAIMSGGVIATPALADYKVSVSSQSRAGHAGPALCSYNYGAADGCSNVGTGPDSGGSVSSSGGSGALATSASASTSQTGVDYGQTLPESTSMAVSSDLRAASLHLASTNSNGSPSSSYGSGGYAAFSDVLHFSVAGASADTITPITVSFSIDGIMVASSAGAPNTGSGELYGAMTFGQSDARFDFLDDVTTNYLTSGTFDTYPSAYPGVWTHSSDNTTAYYTETYNIVGAMSDINVAANARLNCSNGAGCDYGNTAKFGIVTPAGVRFTSDSGVFLTAGAGVGGVPEPTTWAMMIVGFGVVGARLRRRRHEGSASFA